MFYNLTRKDEFICLFISQPDSRSQQTSSLFMHALKRARALFAWLGSSYATHSRRTRSCCEIINWALKVNRCVCVQSLRGTKCTRRWRERVAVRRGVGDGRAASSRVPAARQLKMCSCPVTRRRVPTLSDGRVNVPLASPTAACCI